MVLKHQSSRIEVTVRSNPHVIADVTGTIKSTLYVGVTADENTITDLEGFRMFETGPRVHSQTGTAGTCQSSPQHAAHQRVKTSISLAEAAVELKQTFAAILLAQVLC